MMNGFGRCSNGRPMLSPMVLPPASAAPAIGRLHDARPAAGADHEAVRRRFQFAGPLRDQARQRARVAIVAADRPLFADPRRAEEDDGVLDLLVAKMRERIQIFGEDAQPARIRAFEKFSFR